MSRYTGPKNRIARRFSANIFGRRRNPLLHKPNPAGMHGAKKKKKSDYGIQLEEKQKLRAVYGMITQKQLVTYYKKSLKKQGNTSHILIEMLECRLDNIVYRLGFASTIFHAQQLVSHGHVLVDGKKVDRKSFQVKPGMTVALRERLHNTPLMKELVILNASRTLPEYLTADLQKFEGRLEINPVPDQVPFPLPINIPLVCEFLAHTN